jgi:hypothetical protein
LIFYCCGYGLSAASGGASQRDQNKPALAPSTWRGVLPGTLKISFADQASLAAVRITLALLGLSFAPLK